jgi:N-acetylglucosamine-6-sulfatase
MARHRGRGIALGLLTLALVPALLGVRYAGVAAGERADAIRAEQPNVILIVADDLDKKLLDWMPRTRALIGDQGASFDRFYVEQSTCCTSRATFLTGQYTHNHEVRGNHYPAGGFLRFRDGQEARALPTWLSAAGYRTAMLGKYLNEYPYPGGYVGSEAELAEMRRYVPPGWSSWMSPVDGEPYRQRDTVLNVNGEVDGKPRVEYLDQVFGDRLLDLVSGRDGMNLDEGGRFVYYASYSPHAPYAAPARFRGTFTGVTYPRTPSFDEADVSDKYGLASVRGRVSPRKAREIDQAFRQRIRSVQVLDANIGRLIAKLEADGTLRDTYVIFTSDNGYNMGEHRLDIAKYNHFEETVSVPLLIRGPGIEAGSRIDHLAGNVDIAPTIAAMTGASIPSWVDGTSLLPLLHGESAKPVRSALLLSRGLIPLERKALSSIEEFPETRVESPRHARLADFRAVVTTRWKLVQYRNSSREELYDLRNDPYELENLIVGGWQSKQNMPKWQRTMIRDLRRELYRLAKCAGPRCLT